MTRSRLAVSPRTGGGRLIAAGATVIREDAHNGIPDHVVMADPEGNEFCVL